MKLFAALTILVSLIFSPLLLSQELPLEVGVANVDITPPIGVPLAGFGGPGRRQSGLLDWGDKCKYCVFLNPSIGKIDPIRSKVMLLKRGNRKLLFMSLDLVGITDEFIRDLAKKIKHFGIRKEDIIISATHTHSGPGTLSKRFALALIAADLYKKEIYLSVRSKIIESIYTANQRLELADLYKFKFTAYGIQKNRRKKIGHFDPETNILLAKNRHGEWLGGMVNLAVHGTSLGSKNLKYSADFPGAIEHAVEGRLKDVNLTALAAAPTILFMNGAEGDVKPKHGGLEGMANLSQKFADQFMENLDKASYVTPNWTTRKKKLFVGIPHVNLRACTKGKLRKFIWSKINIPLGTLLPWTSTISLIEIGGAKDLITMMTWPGEATTSLSFELKDLAKKLGRNNPWFIGLANDYMAYFTNKAEFKEGTYEACSSMYGYKGARRIIKKHKKLLMEASLPSN
ncbi:MAG: hypothetical protein HN509_16930 [Halobacteriovoraceae bacterium]|jgi:neutral ceramidase|nr:hypothetical protein [Halobacteriovoraceae bacterium]MBT5093163.1 hypothetical protein [Halobacteriovoraceae bacterium]